MVPFEWDRQRHPRVTLKDLFFTNSWLLDCSSIQQLSLFPHTKQSSAKSLTRLSFWKGPASSKRRKLLFGSFIYTYGIYRYIFPRKKTQNKTKNHKNAETTVHLDG